jgi:hypothetical protein
VSESDDKNNPEQKTVTIYAATGEDTYEPATPPKSTVEVKRLQTKLDSTLQELEETKKKIATLRITKYRGYSSVSR